VAHAAKDLGLSADVLSRWRREYRAHSRKAFPGLYMSIPPRSSSSTKR
jgi:transposase-like protein